jgi:hypothetical protein
LHRLVFTSGGTIAGSAFCQLSRCIKIGIPPNEAVTAINAVKNTIEAT